MLSPGPDCGDLSGVRVKIGPDTEGSVRLRVSLILTYIIDMVGA